MKVFEVITEYENVDKEIIKTIEYVTVNDSCLLSVVDHFTRHCFEYEKELKGVREVLTVVQNIGTSIIAEEIREIYLEEPLLERRE